MTKYKKKILNVGLILDNPDNISFLTNELVNLSKSQSNYKIKTIFINQTFRNNYSNILSRINNYIKRRGWLKFVNHATFSFIIFFEELFLKTFSKYKLIFKSFCIKDESFEFVKIKPNVSKSGLYYSYNSTEINKILKSNVDVLIRCGHGILKGEILNCTKHGVLSYHHGDNNVFRGGPPGFWEVYYKHHKSGFIIQKLNEELDGGEVLFKGSIATAFNFSLNRARLIMKSKVFMDVLLRDISINFKRQNISNKPYYDIIFTTPNFLQQLNYIMMILKKIFIKILSRLLYFHRNWRIGYLFVKKFDDIPLRKIKLIPSKFGVSMADPILLKKNNKKFIFIEQYTGKEQKGIISCIEILKNEKFKVHEDIIKEDFHLSYPYVFKVKQDVFMCPETHAKDEIRLYKAIDFPKKWEFCKTLITNISAADTNIFFHNKKWWMFTNVCKSEFDRSSELHIFYANKFNSSSWTPHPQNPVIFDPLYARNAGNIILKNNIIYRPFQTQSYDNYGNASGLSKIKILTTKKYEEEILFNIKPNFLKRINSTHTYSYLDGLLCIDVK